MKTASLLLLLSVLALSCSFETPAPGGSAIQNPEYSNIQGTVEQPLMLELVHTFGSEDLDSPHFFGQIHSIQLDGEGNLYLYDSANKKLVSFAPNGTLRWAFGREGRGPREFQNFISMLAHPNGNIYVFNEYGARVDVYTGDGEFVRTYNTNSRWRFPRFTAALEDDKALTFSGLVNTPGNLFRLIRFGADSLETISEFEFKTAKDKKDMIEEGMSYSAPYSTSFIGNHLYISEREDYRIQAMDLSGNSLNSIARDFDHFLPMGVYSTDSFMSIRSFSNLSGPKYLKPYDMFLVQAWWATNVDNPASYIERSSRDNNPPFEVNYKSTIDLYDRNWRLLYSLEADELDSILSGLAHIDDEGFAYLIKSEPYARVEKHKIGFDDKILKLRSK